MTRSSVSGDADMRAWLLGRLPETESQKLEEALLEDEEIYTSLESAEDDLFDDYVRGRLTTEEAEAFIGRYGNEKPRLTFAHALAAHQKRRHFPRRMIFAAAAAAVAIAVIGAVFLSQRRDTSEAVSIDRAPITVAVVEPLEIRLGAPRSAGAAPTAELSKNASAIQLLVHLDPKDRYDSYAIELRSPAGDIVWSSGDLRSVERGNDLLLSAAVPATVLVDGSHELTVHGGGESLGSMTVEIRRTD